MNKKPQTLTQTQLMLRTKVETLTTLEQKYALKIKRHAKFPQLVMLCYDQLESPMGSIIAQECRGLILDEQDDWRAVSRPYTKFFNVEEHPAAKIDWSTARALEKLDGSIMSLYFYAGEWQVASNGTPDAGGGCFSHGFTFAELFWRVFAECSYSLPSEEHQNTTFMFELMTKFNRVVVQHPKNRLVLTGGRNRDTGFEFDARVLGERCNYEFVRDFGGLTTEEITASFNGMSPVEQEGYVVVDANFNRVKVKNPAYVIMHRQRDGFSVKSIVELQLLGETSEILAYFPEWSATFELVKQKLDALVSELEVAYEGIKSIENQKDFALEAVKTRLSAALFQLRKGKVRSIRQYLAGMNVKSVLELIGASDIAL